MGKIKKIFKSEYTVSFFLSMLIVVLSIAVMGVYPFGKYTMLCIDMPTQYLDLTVGIAEQIKSGNDILYNWQVGLGTNLYAWATYILFNPLNLLFLITKPIHYQEVYTLIIIIKYGLIASGASIFLKKSKYTNLDGKLNVALAVLYAFCGFSGKAFINPMWLDNIAWLPIVLLGIERVIEKNKLDLLLFSYFVCLMTNYYLAYITGLFALIYFVFYLINVKEHKKTSVVLKSFFICGIAVALAIGLSAIALLPSWKAISSTYKDVFVENMFKSHLKLGIADLMQTLFLVQQQSSIDNCVHGFFGILPIFLTVVFFINKEIKLREKISSFMWIALMLASILVVPLFYIWHFFRRPAAFYGRFLYVVAFLFIMISARCVKKIQFKTSTLLIIPFLVVFIGSFIAVSKRTTYWLLGNAVANIILAIIYVFITYGIKKNKKSSSTVLCCVILLESVWLFLGNLIVSQKADVWINRNKFTNYLTDITALVKETENETEYFRADNLNFYGVNSAMSGGYNSIDLFTSLANQRSLEVLNQLNICSGSNNKQIFNYYNSIVTDSLLNVKYAFIIPTTSIDGEKEEILSKDIIGRNVYRTGGYRFTSDIYKQVFSDEHGYVLKNTLAFPTMFSVSDSVINIHKDFYPKQSTITGGLLNQQTFLNSLFDTDYTMYHESNFTEDELVLKNAEIVDRENEWDKFTLKLTNIDEKYGMANEGDEVGLLGYSTTIKEDGEYLLDLKMYPDVATYQTVNHNIIVNGISFFPMLDINGNSVSPDLGYFKKGDTLNLVTQHLRDIKMIKPAILRLDTEPLKEISKLANQNALNNIRVENNDMCAESNFDKKSLIFTSLAYDDGLTVYIDGEETEKIRIADGFLGYYVPAGKHNIRISYISPGYIEGKVISLVSIALTVIALLLNTKLTKTEKGVTENEEWLTE